MAATNQTRLRSNWSQPPITGSLHTEHSLTLSSDEMKSAELRQEAFEKYWAHSPLRAAARAIHQESLLTPPAHRCPRQRQRRQRQRMTDGTAMAPWNRPNDKSSVDKAP